MPCSDSYLKHLKSGTCGGGQLHTSQCMQNSQYFYSLLLLLLSRQYPTIVCAKSMCANKGSSFRVSIMGLFACSYSGTSSSEAGGEGGRDGRQAGKQAGKQTKGAFMAKQNNKRMQCCGKMMLRPRCVVALVAQTEAPRSHFFFTPRQGDNLFLKKRPKRRLHLTNSQASHLSVSMLVGHLSADMGTGVFICIPPFLPHPLPRPLL